MISPHFSPGLYLTVNATGLTPGTRYWVVWYAYRSENDPAPARYSFTPQPCPPSGVLTVKAPYWILQYYAGEGAVIERIRAFVALRGSEEPVLDPQGNPYCASWDTYEALSLDDC